MEGGWRAYGQANWIGWAVSAADGQGEPGSHKPPARRCLICCSSLTATWMGGSAARWDGAAVAAQVLLCAAQDLMQGSSGCSRRWFCSVLVRTAALPQRSALTHAAAFAPDSLPQIWSLMHHYNEKLHDSRDTLWRLSPLTPAGAGFWKALAQQEARAASGGGGGGGGGEQQDAA